MLPSQIASVSHTSITPALFQSSICSSTAMLRSAGTLRRRSRPRNQIRTFRIGLWSSYLDPEFQREEQRRRRIAAHQYMEALNRKLSRERQNILAPTRVGFKRFMCSAWRSKDSKHGGRWVDVDELNKTNNGPGQQSNSRGIEDVEQNAFDKLLNTKDGLYDRVRERSRTWLMSANSAMNPILGFTSVKVDTPRRATYGQEDFQRRFQRLQSQQASEPDLEYEIDPITNRKVFKNKTLKSPRKPIEVPVKTFKGYRSQFQDLSPPTSQPTGPEVKTYIPPSSSPSKPVGGTGKHSDPATESSNGYEKTNKYKSLFHNEAEGQTPEPMNESPVEIDRKARYEVFNWNCVYDIRDRPRKPETPDPVRESLKEYENKNPIGPVLYRDPDGKLPENPNSVRESLEEYEKKHPNSAVRYGEPDDKSAENPCPVQEGLKEYDSRVKYGPVMWNEPDGKLPQEPCPVQEGLKEYDSRVKYGPVMWNEPDGQPPPKRDPVTEGLRDFDERADYGRSRRILKNIYFGKAGSGGRDMDRSFRYSSEDTKEDLDLLRPSDVRAASGIITGTKKETPAEKLAVRRKLEDDFQKQQDDYTSSCEDLSTTRDAKPRSDHKTKDVLDLHNITHEGQAAGIQATRNKLMEELKIENSELRNIQAHLRGRVDAELAAVSAELSAKSPQRKITGNYMRDFPEEFETKWTSAQDSGSLKPEKEIISQDVAPASEGPFARSSSTPRIQTSLDRTAGEVSIKMESEEEARSQNDVDPYPEVPQGLETSYADELGQKRTVELLELERDPYSKIPQGLEISYATEKEEQRLLELERDPYSKVPQGLETSYATEKAEAAKLQNAKNLYSKKSAGLESSYMEKDAASQPEGDLSTRGSSFGKRNEAEEDKRARQLAKQEKKNLMKQMDRDLVREIRNIYEEKYGTLDLKHRQIDQATAASEPLKGNEGRPEVAPVSETQEPTVYKILAYDPTMQEINTAETASFVPDSASALTPAEVLLRLSNPAKFFPHFQPLQAEGYEIVSGSGDVLVFRKARPAGSQGSKSEVLSSIQDLKRKTTNPIDGMQSSPIAATGNFASPTGFVNHDLPVSEPPFKSNIDVRREETVFSGKPNWQEESESTRRRSNGRGKRLLIGAAWVAACSYAIGVVAEFFRTGGMDGRGPQGF